MASFSWKPNGVLTVPSIRLPWSSISIVVPSIRVTCHRWSSSRFDDDTNGAMLGSLIFSWSSLIPWSPSPARLKRFSARRWTGSRRRTAQRRAAARPARKEHDQRHDRSDHADAEREPWPAPVGDRNRGTRVVRLAGATGGRRGCTRRLQERVCGDRRDISRQRRDRIQDAEPELAVAPGLAGIVRGADDAVDDVGRVKIRELRADQGRLAGDHRRGEASAVTYQVAVLGGTAGDRDDDAYAGSRHHHLGALGRLRPQLSALVGTAHRDDARNVRGGADRGAVHRDVARPRHHDDVLAQRILDGLALGLHLPAGSYRYVDNLRAVIDRPPDPGRNLVALRLGAGRDREDLRLGRDAKQAHVAAALTGDEARYAGAVTVFLVGVQSPIGCRVRTQSGARQHLTLQVGVGGIDPAVDDSHHHTGALAHLVRLRDV